MSQLQNSMCLMLNTFEKYAKTDGDPNSLSKSEVKTLLEKEMPEMISVMYTPKGIPVFLLYAAKYTNSCVGDWFWWLSCKMKAVRTYHPAAACF